MVDKAATVAGWLGNEESTTQRALSAIVARWSSERSRSWIEDADPQETERSIEHLLGQFADAFGAHRVLITEESSDRITARITHEWTAPGVEPRRAQIGEFSFDALPWLRDRLVRGETVYIPVVEDLPPEAKAERLELSRRNTVSALALPLTFGPQTFGMVGFEWPHHEPDLPLDDVALKMVQGMVAAELHARQSGSALRRTNRVLRAMIECSDALLRADDEITLLEDVCRIIVEIGGYALAWVGFGARDEEMSVTPVAKWGNDDHYLDNLRVTWADSDNRGRGPVSRAVRTGMPVAVQSVATDPDFAPWRDMALQRAYKSVLAVSLDFGDELQGALGVYASEAWAFDAVEIEMMQRFGAYLAYGIVALRNRTERAKVEAQLRQALRSKDELIASISHELRTPLTAVVGFSQLLRDDAGMAREEREAMIRSIVDEGLDLSNIVEDLLTVARAEAGTLAVVRVPVDLRAQAAQVCDTLREEDAARVTLTGTARRAHADPGRVRQILRNLVSNALRYGGEHIVVAVVDGGGPRVQVRDTGTGIPPQDRERIFESYQKAHDTPGVTGSVGLGLAISRRLARLMGGDLTYTHEDGQNVFELSVPS